MSCCCDHAHFKFFVQHLCSVAQPLCRICVDFNREATLLQQPSALLNVGKRSVTKVSCKKQPCSSSMTPLPSTHTPKCSTTLRMCLSLHVGSTDVPQKDSGADTSQECSHAATGVQMLSSLCCGCVPVTRWRLHVPQACRACRAYPSLAAATK